MNIDNLLINDYQSKLDNLNKNDFSNKEDFSNACLSLAKKMASKHKIVRNNYINFTLANLIACNSKPLNTQKDIIRFAWDFNNMNFN